MPPGPSFGGPPGTPTSRMLAGASPPAGQGETTYRRSDKGVSCSRAMVRRASMAKITSTTRAPRTPSSSRGAFSREHPGVNSR